MSSTDGSPQSLNLYAYVRNNPIDYVDPSGLNLSFGGGFCIEREWVTVDKNNIPTIHYSQECFFTGGGGGLQDLLRPATNNEIDYLRGGLNFLTDTATEAGKKCNDFLNNVLTNLDANDFNISRIFETIAKKKGGIVVSNDPNQSSGEALNTSNGTPPILRFKESVFEGMPKAGDSISADGLIETGGLVIEEVIHAAGRNGNRFNHYQMAKAYKKTAVDLKIISQGEAMLTKGAMQPKSSKPEDVADAEANNTSVMSRIFKKACNPN